MGGRFGIEAVGAVACAFDGPAERWGEGVGAFAVRREGPGGPARRMGVVRGERGTWLAGTVRLDRREDLRRQLGEAAPRHGGRRWEEDLRLAVAAVERWGEGAGERLSGDFAWVAGGEAGWVAYRDPLGVMPLYLRRVRHPEDGSALFLSTSAAALREVAPRLGGEGELDAETLADFLLFGDAMDPEATGWREVRGLPPGHLLRIRSGGGGRVEQRRYYDLAALAPSRLGVDSAAVRLRQVLDEAVADRLPSRDTAGGSDGEAGPVGVLGGGGLDAAVVAASLRAQGVEGRLYVYDYAELLGDDTAEWARRTADHLGFPLTVVAADAVRPWSDLGALSADGAVPIHEPFFPVTVELARRARADGCRVLLTGEGADDLLHATPDDLLAWLLAEPVAAGSALFATARRALRLPRLGLRSALLRRLGLARLLPGATPWRPEPPPWLDPELVSERLEVDRRRPESAPSGHRRGAALADLLHPRAEAVHRWWDVPAAAAGVEIRHPFLDRRVVEHLLSLPPHPHCRRKAVLRRAARDRLPESVRLRPKALLPGEPLLAHLRDPAWDREATTAPHPELARFMNLRTFRFRLATADAGQVWRDTRPVSLALWLQRQPASV